MKLKHALIQAACAAAAFSATAVMAQTVVGGGATLPEFLYKQEIQQFPADYSYASTGSGAGKTALLTNNPAAFNTATGRNDTVVHFAGSDSVLSSTEISNFNTAAAGPLVQMPSVATAVGIPFKNGLANLTLSTDQLCGIFSGKINDWNAINAGFPAGTAIKVVYRGDSSGTTEILTRHLAAVCTTGTSGNSNVAFTAGTTFANNFPGGVPSNFSAATGSGGVRDAVDSLGNAIGYLSPDYINATLAPSSTVATKNLPAARLTNKNNGVSYTPTAANTTAGLSTATLGANLALPASWAPTVANPASGYPIVGFTFLDHVQCYADANVRSKILAFLDAHTNYTTAQVNRINGNGFAPLPTAIVDAIRGNLLANNNSLNLNIGNATACAGKAGR
ncbi:substrate-binding domain-containing protein [Cupriavidus sp. SZY C1]|uniref:substrate-binding domain-containing protein n=1 Tax=Cupriavidus sp. SZY C1 TaxID=3055037 RepID=UPI0028B72C61|nr:substrate-binding domain-containing protein [Cupriavidus sp. SZY C1]MDT6964279.1 substrate-binding domain-containing protein [Cupriavidus sp. SZY C1]